MLNFTRKFMYDRDGRQVEKTRSAFVLFPGTKFETTVYILKGKNGQVSVGVDAPDEVIIVRKELMK